MDRSESTPAATSAPHVYCATLPYSGVRKLAADELSQLNARRDSESRSLRSVTRWGIVATIIYVAVGIAFLRFWSDQFPKSTIDDIMIVGLIEVIVGAVGVLFFKDKYGAHERVARALDAQLKDPQVRQFAGTFPRDPLNVFDSEPGLEALMEHELIDFDNSSWHVLELFLKRDILYRVDDRYLHDFEPIPIQVIAPRPDNAPTFMVPDSWFAPEVEPPHVERRRLSDEEIGELRGFISRTKRLLLIAVTVMPLLVVYFAAGTAERTGQPWIGVAVGVVFSAFLFWHAARTLSLMRRLRADLEENWILIGSPDNTTPYDPRKHVREQDYVEILASSGIPWTLNGLPASWRGRRM